MLIATLQAADIKWTDEWMAYGTVGGALATFLAVVAALLIALWLSPKLAEDAAKRAEDRQRRRDEDAELHRFRTAALLVYDELKANLALIEIAKETSEIPEPLAFEAYAAYQLLLAQHLNPDDRDDVRAAYVYARTRRVFVQKGAFAEVSGSEIGIEDRAIPQNVDAARKKIERAMMVLGEEAKKLPGAFKEL